MSNIEKGFVPLPEAKTDQVRMQLELPSFVDKHKIGVNLRSIHKLCQIGGIHQLMIAGIDNDETSHATPTILGFNAQGNAFAGKTGEKTDAPLQRAQSVSDNDVSHLELPAAMNWKHTLIIMNMNEVRAKISNDTRWSDGVRSTDAWSHYMNKGIKDGLKQEGTHHLLFDVNQRDKIYLGFIATLTLLNASGIDIAIPFSSHLRTPTVPGIIKASAYWNALYNVFARIFDTRFNLSDKAMRYSFFYGPQPDRALLLNILTRAKTLIKTIEESKKA